MPLARHPRASRRALSPHHPAGAPGPAPAGRPAYRLATLAIAAALAAGVAGGAAARLDETGAWPTGGATADRPVSFASSSPFVPAEAGPEAPVATARARYYPPVRRDGGGPAPAVVLLHGAGGVSAAREGTYARQFAASGVAALVIDVFGARPALSGGFVERLLNVTETMAVADAYAGLAWLAHRPEVDGERVALIGFSYGGISTLAAAHAQMADLFAPDGPRFAAHVAFYGPCIARFEDMTTTRAPVLMLWGGRDAIVDEAACAALAADLAAGGSAVDRLVFEDAYHRWDGAGHRPWRARRHIADCRFRVDRDGRVRDEVSGLAMTGPVTRRLILAACSSDEGYLIGGDGAIRQHSNAALARFLNPVLFPAAAASPPD